MVVMRRGSIGNGRITEVKRRIKNTKEIVPDLRAMMIQAMTVKQKGEAKNPSKRREDTTLHQKKIMTEKELIIVKNLHIIIEKYLLNDNITWYSNS